MKYQEFIEYYKRIIEVCGKVGGILNKNIETGYPDLSIDGDIFYCQVPLYFSRCCGDEYDSFKVNLSLFDKYTSNSNVAIVMAAEIAYERKQAKLQEEEKQRQKKEEAERIATEAKEAKDLVEWERLKLKFGNK